MRRACGTGLLPGVFLMASCSQSPEQYLKIAREQRDAQKEIAAILATVEDEKTLAAAREKLDERVERFDKIAQKASSLPRPTPETAARLDEERFAMESAAKSLQTEVARVRGLKLKGGPDFFRHFESRNHTLFQAVQP